MISFSIGPLVDHLHEPTTQIACGHWSNFGISVGPTLAATIGLMAFGLMLASQRKNFTITVANQIAAWSYVAIF